jgi:hypothetical protein
MNGGSYFIWLVFDGYLFSSFINYASSVVKEAGLFFLGVKGDLLVGVRS